jgi:transmembrane sensor
MPSDLNHNGEVSAELLERRALDWIVRITSGEATDADRQAFARWRATAPEYEAAALQAIRTWRDTGAAAASMVAMKPSARPLYLSRRMLLQGGALAASVTGAAVLGAEFGFLPTLRQAFADYRTTAGEQRRLDIADGISIDLNTRTGLAVDSDKDGRNFRLVGGEAAFTVKLRSDRPLVLQADNVSVSANQAVFVVRIEDRSVLVSCLEGSVDLMTPDSRTLKPPQQARCDGGGAATVATADPALVAGWRRGQLVFRDEALSAVVSELNRYKKGKIVIVDRAAASRRVSGVFHLNRIDEALDHLQVALGIPIRHFSSYVTLIG